MMPKEDTRITRWTPVSGIHEGSMLPDDEGRYVTFKEHNFEIDRLERILSKSNNLLNAYEELLDQAGIIYD